MVGEKAKCRGTFVPGYGTVVAGLLPSESRSGAGRGASGGRSAEAKRGTGRTCIWYAGVGTFQVDHMQGEVGQPECPR